MDSEITSALWAASCERAVRAVRQPMGPPAFGDATGGDPDYAKRVVDAAREIFLQSFREPRP